MPLSWGRHYVMVEPTHFRIDYVINPYMLGSFLLYYCSGLLAAPRRVTRMARTARRAELQLGGV